MKGPALKSLTVDGIPAIAMEKSSDHVSMGERTVIPSGYASFGTVRLSVNCLMNLHIHRYSGWHPVYCVRVQEVQSSGLRSLYPAKSGCTRNT